MLQHHALQATRRIALACLLVAGTTLPGAGQTPHVTQLEGMDFDALISCSIIYQRVAETYDQKGDAEQSEEFRNAAMAYSASAYHVLGYRQPDPAKAFEYSESRMPLIIEALNTQSEEAENGDADVIAQWLPYCDHIGQNVNFALEKRAERGW